MSDQPSVSIVIPLYNCAAYVQRCLGSLSRQTCRDFEVVLVDDCSTDQTLALCEPYLNSDARFRLIRAPRNGGPARARNLGLESVSGRFLLFLDGDDWLSDDAVDVLVKAQQASQADLVVAGFNRIDMESGTATAIQYLEADQDLDSKAVSRYLARGLAEPNRYSMFHYCWGRLYATPVVKEQRLGFREDLRICEDIHFQAEFLRHAQHVHFIRTPIYQHTPGHPNSAGMVTLSDDPWALPFYEGIWTAYSSILRCILALDPSADAAEMDRLARSGHISHSIVLLVRACGSRQKRKGQLRDFVHCMVHHPDVVENLRHYQPKPGHSRLLPQLMRWKAAWAIIRLGAYMHRKRYKKKRN